MNKVVLMGRLVRDPEIRYSQGENSIAIARYTLAVNRRYANTEQNVDFINCIAFGRLAEVAQKYLKQGSKITLSGRIQTGSYTNKDGIKVYTTDIIVDEQEFAESKSLGKSQENLPSGRPESGNIVSDYFISIPEGVEAELPFN